MATDLMKRLRESASDLTCLSGKSASVSADVVAEYDDVTHAITTRVTYSAVMLIDDVKWYVSKSKSPSDAALAMAALSRVEAMRADAKELGYGLVRLPDAKDLEAGK